MDIILLLSDHPPTLVDIFYVLNLDKNGKFKTTYPPSVVHVVFEWSLKAAYCNFTLLVKDVCIRGTCKVDKRETW